MIHGDRVSPRVSSFGLAELSRRTDKHEQAQEHLTSATTMNREMGMTYWLEKAEVREG